MADSQNVQSVSDEQLSVDSALISQALAKKPPAWPKIMLAFIVTVGIVGYGIYYFVNKKVTTDKSRLQSQIDDLNKKITASACLKEGEAAENASLGPNGHFGTCCPGLEPRAKAAEVGLDGNASYCTKTTSSSTATPAVTLNKDIESVDFSRVIAVDTKIGDTLETPTYADLNGDNSEEALVAHRYSGTAAAADFYIFRMKDGTKFLSFKKSAGGTIAIKNGSVYVDFRDPEAAVNIGKDNASMVLSHVKYTWNGTTYAESNQ